MKKYLKTPTRERNYLLNAYSMDKIFASPSMSGPANLYNMLYLEQILIKLTELTELFKEDEK